MEEFLLICPIGLEKLLLSEIQTKWKLHFKDAPHKISLIQGGIELNCALEQGLALNHIIRGTSKILWRLKKQKCRDLPKLYNIIRKFPWKNYFASTAIEFKVSAKKSRLIHSDKIKQSALNGIKDYFEANKIKQSVLDKHQHDPIQTIHLRLFEDELTISLDTSGELLHIRGDSSHRGHASIRENIASLLLWSIVEQLSDGDQKLIDPMCGTGTFLKEASRQFDLLERNFNYQYLNEGLNIEFIQMTPIKSPWRLELQGYDIDENVLKNNQGASILYAKRDVFEQMNGTLEQNPILVLNPPYGKRVKIKGDKIEYFQNLVAQLSKNYAPTTLGIIIPVPFERPFKAQKLYFKQNGIDVCWLVFKQKKV